MAMASHVSGTPHNGTHSGDFDSPLENFVAARPEVPETDHFTWSFSYEQTMSYFCDMTLDQGRWGEKPKQEDEAEGGDKEEKGKEMASPCDVNLTKLTDEVQ